MPQDESVVLESERERMRHVIEASRCRIAGDRYFATRKVPAVYDLDRVWHHPDHRHDAIQILTSILGRFDDGLAESGKLTTVVGITTQTGAFGFLPVIAGASAALGKHLAIIQEYSLEHYTLFPSAFARDFPTDLTNCAVVFDVLFCGTALTRGIEFIRRRGHSSVALVLVVIDFGLEERVLSPDEMEFTYASILTLQSGKDPGEKPCPSESGT